jgi:signal transduction histidine kinase
MEVSRNLTEQYSAQLASHLAASNESVLLDAHELGRRAVIDGVGVLDLVNVHHDALRALVAAGGVPTGSKYLDTAAEFLAEALSPFEMMLRGYKEANSRLLAANQELREAKVAVESAHQELETFSYSVAHDLRAPLRSLNGFGLILLEDYAEKLDEEGRHCLRYIRESAQEMAQLIDDLLELSRVTRGEFRRERINLTDIARTIAARLQNEQPARRVHFAIADGLVDQGDARLLAVALENLIGNAWKYSSKRAETRIEVGASDSDGPRAYFVRDNGAGFDMQYAGKLFGVFQRLHAEAEFEGTGIGLVTVQRIIRRHGGRIWAEAKSRRGCNILFYVVGESPVADTRREFVRASHK